MHGTHGMHTWQLQPQECVTTGPPLQTIRPCPFPARVAAGSGWMYLAGQRVPAATVFCSKAPCTSGLPPPRTSVPNPYFTPPSLAALPPVHALLSDDGLPALPPPCRALLLWLLLTPPAS